MKYLLSCTFILFMVGAYAQDVRVTLVNQEKEVLPFVKVYFMSDGKFTSTGKDGVFLVDKTRLSEQVLISGFGLKDTLVNLSSVMVDKTISLKVKDFELPQFDVTGSKLKELHLGKVSNPIYEPQNVLKLIDKGEPKDTKYASWVQLPKRKEKIISKVSFYVADIQKEEVMSLRFLGSNSGQGFKAERVYSTAGLDDLASNPIVITVSESGWHTIELGEQVVVGEKIKELFVVFELLKPSDDFSLAYQYDQEEEVQMAFYSPEQAIIGRFDKNKEVFAVVLELLVEG